jgi:isoaspartyl peptidase/L-asparaginase-like protein (Ntn-hydrolase superfamily)
MKDSRHVFLVGEGGSFASATTTARNTRSAGHQSTSDRPPSETGPKPGKRKQSRAGEADHWFAPSAAAWTLGWQPGTSTGAWRTRCAAASASPLIRRGPADDRAAAPHCTGEVFIRHAVAHDVVARMVYGKLDVSAAVRETINELPEEPEGVGGLIALDKNGRAAFGMSEKSLGMYRGYVTDKGEIHVAIYKEEPRRVNPVK